jgi:hypothetical protein
MKAGGSSMTSASNVRGGAREMRPDKKGGNIMCYNCGCGSPQEDHGKGHMGVDPNGKAITEKTFEEAGKAFQMDLDASKKNTCELIRKK